MVVDGANGESEAAEFTKGVMQRGLSTYAAIDLWSSLLRSEAPDES